MTKHELVDGVAMKRSHPKTFKIPSTREKAKIQSGDFVKVGFVVDDPAYKYERMWVRVESVQGDKISGVLDNEPVFAEAELGDPIELELRHVLAIQR